jgi:RalA-binding protein 1
MDLAADFFTRYTERMAPHLPAVIFPPSQTVAELRRSKPILFLAIMAAASSEVHSLQSTLQRELMVIFAEKVFLSGEKSLELVQALLVAVIWYWPPEHFEELKFYQLVHVAAVMAIDLGLGRRGAPRRPLGAPYSWQAHSFRRQAPVDPTSIESRRAWLGCYFLTCNTSMSLHRPNLVRWTPFMSECIDILNSSPDAAPTDKYFCHLVLQHQLGEDICGQLSLDDPANVVDINDPRTQYALKAHERDLEKAKDSVPEDLLKRKSFS